MQTGDHDFRTGPARRFRRGDHGRGVDLIRQPRLALGHFDAVEPECERRLPRP
jgi:hypothetical protein